LNHDLVWALHEDRSGTLWIGTDGGLSRFDHSDGRFTRYRHDPDDPHSLSNDRVYALHEDRHGRLWVSTANGLNQLDRLTGRFRRYLYSEAAPREWRSDILYGIAVEPLARPHVIRGICDDPLDPDVRWVSTACFDSRRHPGATDVSFRLDRQSGKFTQYHHDPDDPFSLSSSNINFLYEDRGGTLWVGTYGGGLHGFDRSNDL
jgi:ligand-binding sensor domain-containing protein